MLRVLFSVILIFWATASAGENLRQFNARTSTSLGEIILALETQLPGQVVMTGERKAVLAYAGNRLPPQLAGFLATAFEHLPSEVLVPGRAVSLSLSLIGQDAGTDMSLMMMAAFPVSGVPLVPDSVMMMDGSGPGACTGQMVVRHDKPRHDSARIWQKHLKNQGFVFGNDDENDMSFFIGRRPGCEIALYLHPNRNTTMVVIRYLEE